MKTRQHAESQAAVKSIEVGRRLMRPRKTPDAEGDGLLATQQQSLKINSLERENLELKKLVANLSLDKEVLMSVIRKHGSTI